jgi:predicted transcriptional regulator
MLPDLGAIRSRRKTLDITQRRFAELAGTTQSYLAKVERGQVIPNYLLAGRIFRALEAEEHRTDKKVGDVMRTPVISFQGSDTVAEAAQAAKLHGVSQFPILQRGHSVGSVTTAQLVGVETDVPLGRIMGPSLPSVDPTLPISVVRQLLRAQPAVLVVERGQVRGIVSAEDLL